ncbi:hypothetical protein [Bradyrhizobium yuanmingense]|uniref:hypothetical protein n=1 Tax=Bradyrhizobium yuanmingense TaxID=108015 RepID=UPI0023B9E733|nr:hypothetical protein [Bradyrhizobium yuanmingense]MDF0582144.1 hypothetical protein [Bradyrhizobium yuanmingense]
MTVQSASALADQSLHHQCRRGGPTSVDLDMLRRHSPRFSKQAAQRNFASGEADRCL